MIAFLRDRLLGKQRLSIQTVLVQKSGWDTVQCTHLREQTKDATRFLNQPRTQEVLSSLGIQEPVLTIQQPRLIQSTRPTNVVATSLQHSPLEHQQIRQRGCMLNRLVQNLQRLYMVAQV